MIDVYLQDFLYKTSTQEFISSANALLTFLENGGNNKDIGLYLVELQKLLSKLYYCGLGLENVDIQFSEDIAGVGVHLGKINFAFSEQLGKDAFYCDVFDPLCYNKYVEEGNLENIGKEVTQGWLLDDISDIYNNIKPHLIELESKVSNSIVENALFELKFGFDHHWGKHCIDAMRFLHHYIRK